MNRYFLISILVLVLLCASVYVLFGSTGARCDWSPKLDPSVNDGAAIKAIKYLKRGDEFCVIGIDAKCTGDKVIRLTNQDVNVDANNPMALTPVIGNFIKQVSALKVRATSSGYIDPVTHQMKGKPEGTDLIGAFAYAADLATKEAKKGFIPRILVCSDFQDAVPKRVGLDILFPSGSLMRAFYVVRSENATSTVADEQLKQAWSRRLKTMGLDVEADRDFFDKTQSDKIEAVAEFMGQPVEGAPHDSSLPLLTDKPVYLIVMIDETGSFIADADGWNRSLKVDDKPAEFEACKK